VRGKKGGAANRDEGVIVRVKPVMEGDRIQRQGNNRTRMIPTGEKKKGGGGRWGEDDSLSLNG